MYLTLALLISILLGPIDAASTWSAECDGSAAVSALMCAPSAVGFCSELLSIGVDYFVTTVTDNWTYTNCETTATGADGNVISTSYDYVYTSTITVPAEQITIYESTVLVPSGTLSPPIMCEPTETPVTTTTDPVCGQYVGAFCTCSRADLSKACSSVVPTTPTGETYTTWHETSTGECNHTTISSTFTETNGGNETTYVSDLIVETNYGITTIFPTAAETVYRTTETATMTVPYACAQSPYLGTYVSLSNATTLGLAEYISPIYYPDVARTAVECCVLCYTSDTNCFMSIFNGPNDDGPPGCYLVTPNIYANGDAPGPKNQQCPSGWRDYPFGPQDPNGTWWPGPCGYGYAYEPIAAPSSVPESGAAS